MCPPRPPGPRPLHPEPVGGVDLLTDRKLKRSTLSMPKALSCRMTGARLERCISGTVEEGSFSKSSSEDRRRQRQGIIQWVSGSEDQPADLRSSDDRLTDWSGERLLDPDLTHLCKV